jgi:hypothetical protein
MHSRLVRTLLSVTAVILLAASAAIAEETEEFELVPADEQVFAAIQCIRADPNQPTCDSVVYELQLAPGDSTVGTVPGNTTPASYINYTQSGQPNYQDFFAGDSLAPTYVLRTDEPVTGQVTVQGYGGSDTSLDATVSVRLTATRTDAPGMVTLGEVESNKVVATPTAEGRTFEFEFDLDEALEEQEVRNLSLGIAYRGIHVLTSGFLNGQGGTFFDLPYYEVVPVVEAEAG